MMSAYLWWMDITRRRVWRGQGLTVQALSTSWISYACK